MTVDLTSLKFQRHYPDRRKPPTRKPIERQPSNRITPARYDLIVSEIRRRKPWPMIAKMFGVTPRTIERIDRELRKAAR